MTINHLFFKDDNILFGEVTKEGAKNIHRVVSGYERPGQMIIYDKSLIYFGANVTERDRIIISNTLRVRVSLNLEKYLGLPMMVGRSKERAFVHYVDKIRSRLDN